MQSLLPSLRTPLLAAMLLNLALPAASAPADSASSPAAPRFQLPTDSGSVDSDSLRGQVVLVDFWASWCPPCQESFPWLVDMDRRYSAQGLRVVAINLDKRHGPAETFLEKHPVPFTVAFDPHGTVAQAFRVRGMPSSFLVDRDGNVVYSHVGFDPKKAGEFEAVIRKACS